MAANVATERLDPAELVDYLKGILWGCWRFRWPAIACAWALALAGWVFVFLQPDVHRASARVYVDTQSALKPLLQGIAVNTDAMVAANMMTRMLMGRPNLERLVDQAGLLPEGESSRREAVIDHLRTTIKLNWDNGNVVSVSYENTDRVKALAVVTAILDSFIAGAQGKGEVDTAAARSFLDDQLKDYAVRLNDAESKLADFKRKNVGLMPEDGTDYYERLQEATARLQEIDSRLRVARNRRAELQRQLEGEEPVFGLVPADEKSQRMESAEDRQIAQYEAQLAELRLKYTDTHPDIVAITATIEELRAKKDAAAVGGPRVRSYSPLDLNPVYQQMKLQLSQTDVQIAQLQTEHNDQAAVVGGLRRKVDTVPAIEAELKRLTRDYDFTKKQYEELLGRVETARISGAAEQSGNEATFRVIEPPALPAQPVGPPRGILSTAVLLAALLAGAALALGLNFTQPVFYTSRELERRFGVPVLGTVRLVRDAEGLATARRNWVLALGSVGALVAVYVVLVASWLAVRASAGASAAGAVS